MQKGCVSNHFEQYVRIYIISYCSAYTIWIMIL
jgi:hypothetical protein